MGHSFVEKVMRVESIAYRAGMARLTGVSHSGLPLFYPAGLLAGRAFFRRFHGCFRQLFDVDILRGTEFFVY